jgi:DnaJ-class molecular chaperone
MCYITMNEETDNNGINIWELPEHLETCPKCYGSGEIDTSMLPYDYDYRREIGTWNDHHPKCFYCNGSGYIEREIDTQWETLGTTSQQALED